MKINKILLDLVNLKKLKIPKDLDWEGFYRKLVDNELNIFFYEEAKRKRYKIPKKISEKLKKDYKKFEIFKKSLDYFLELVKKNKIKNYTLIKLKKIQKAHTDLDILISPKNLKFLADILKKQGFKVKDNLGFEISLRKKIPQGQMVFDIHSRLDYNNVSFLDSESVLKNKRKMSYLKKKIIFISDEDDFIITLVHSFFQKLGVRRTQGFNQLRWSEITLSDLYQLKYASESKNFDWDYVIKTSKEYGWRDALIYCLMVLNHFFPSDERVKIISRITPRSKVSYYKDVNHFDNLPFYTSILTTYFIALRKLHKEFQKSLSRGIKYLYNMHKWFLSNGARVIYYNIKG